MIYTSYFAKLNKLPNNITPVAICGKAPMWYTGLQYKPLAPKYDFFMKYKQDHDREYYTRCFNEQVLDRLDIYKVLTDLHMKLPLEAREKIEASVWESERYHIALICYEKPTDFCHRHIVSDWLNANKIVCREWE